MAGVFHHYPLKEGRKCKYMYLAYRMHTVRQGHCWCMQRHSWRALDSCSDYTCSSQVDKDGETDHSDSWEDPE